MNNRKKDPLVDLFTQLPKESLSSSFREQMMLQVMKEQAVRRKRNRLWSIAGIILTVLVLSGSGIWALLYIDWSLVSMPEIDMSVTFPTLSSYSFYIYLSVLAGILLLIDHLFRKHYLKKEKRDTI